MGCVCSTESRRRSKVVKYGDLLSSGVQVSDDRVMGVLDPGKVVASGKNQGMKVPVSIGEAVKLKDAAEESKSSFAPRLRHSHGARFQGNKICILAFEVANTIGKAANLMQALSDESIQFLKEVIFNSHGVRQLISQGTMDLLKIAAADQREEFKYLSVEVARLGKLCKDTKWHCLDHYFKKLDLDLSRQGKRKEEATSVIQQLTILAQHTCELYQQLNAFDRVEQDYRRKCLEEESMPASLRGEGLVIYHNEFKRQEKLIKGLKKKSLWSRNLHEIVEKLVQVVIFLHHATFEASDLVGTDLANFKAVQTAQRLGPSGLDLHYANIVNQITNTVSRPLSFNQFTRDAFYHGLPSSVKAALCSRLQQFSFNGELTSVQIKAEMHKILQWLSPMAESTIKSCQAFGSIGEFANAGIEFSSAPIYIRKTIRIQTLYHADKEKTEEFILQLVVWLHHLVKQLKERRHISKSSKPIKYPLYKDERAPPQVDVLPPSSTISSKIPEMQLSPEDREMLEHANDTQHVLLRRSKSLGSFNKKGKRGETRKFPRESCGSSPLQDFGSDIDSHVKRIRVLNSFHVLETFNY